jgi:hypothetical protein
MILTMPDLKEKTWYKTDNHKHICTVCSGRWATKYCYLILWIGEGKGLSAAALLFTCDACRKRLEEGEDDNTTKA